MFLHLETIEYIEENTETKLLDLRLEEEFMNFTSKARGATEKINGTTSK